MPRSRTLATALLAATLGSSVLVAYAQTPQPYIPGPDHCLLVKNPDARKTCQLARTEYYKSHYTGALALINKAIAISPGEGALHVVQASISGRFEAFGPAEQQLRLARKDGAPDHIVLPQLFNVMTRRHEENILLNEFPEPASDAKGEVASDILQGRAVALLALNQTQAAAAAMDRSLFLYRDADGLLARADIALKQNDSALADKLVDEAYRLDPKSPSVMVAKIKRLERGRDNAGVLAVSDQMIALYPIFSDSVAAKVRVFLKLNQDAKAHAVLDAYSKIRPKSAVIGYYKAVLLSRAKDKMGAAQRLQALPLQFSRDNPDYALQMAQIALDNGNVENAASILGAALGGAPDRVDLRLKLAEIRASQGDAHSALQILNPVNDSKDPGVQTLRKKIQAQIARDRL